MTAAVDCGKMADLKAQQTEIERCLSKTDDIFHLLGRSVIFQKASSENDGRGGRLKTVLWNTRVLVITFTIFLYPYLVS